MNCAVSPPFDPSGNTALIGATMMYEILYILAEKQNSASSPQKIEIL